MKNLLSICFLMFCFYLSYSQTFERTYYDYVANCIIQNEDSSFVTTNGGRWLTKLSQVGDSIYAREFSTYYGIGVSKIIKSNDGNYLVGGSSLIVSTFGYNACALRVDSNLDTLWSKQFPHDLDQAGISEILEANDSSVVFSMISNDSPFSGIFLDRLVCLDRNGNLIWQTDSFETDIYVCNIAVKDTELYSIISQNQNGNFLTVLTCQNISDGDTLWQSTFNNPDPAGWVFFPLSLLATDSNLFAAGYLRNNSSSNSMFRQAIFKASLNGDSLWMHQYGPGNLRKIISTSSNKLYCVGNQNNDSIVLMYLDSSGVNFWSRYYLQFDKSTAMDLISTSDGGFAIGGSAEFPGTMSYAYVIRTNSMGNLNSVVGVPEVKNLPVKYHFNNENHLLLIELEEKSKLRALVYSIDGKLLMDQSLDSKMNSIDANSLSLGQYIVVIRKENSIVSQYRFNVF